MKNTIIKDESGDRKYFTQIPNIIVNHSTAYEQSLYLIMKRLAGDEKGICYASLNWLAKKMGVHKTTVSKVITKLLKREWIKEIKPKIVKGGRVRQFVIVDLWKLNILNYESGAKMTTSDTLSGANSNGSGAIIDGSGAKSDTKNIDKEDILRKKEILKKMKEEFIRRNII